MKRLLFILSILTLSLGSAFATHQKIKEYKLKNGLTVWLDVDKTQPKVWGAVVVKAGAIDSPNTGIAHYFEHIMFKGTDKIGTTDYAKEKIYLDSVSTKYSQLAQTRDNVEREKIQKDINRLSIAAAQYSIPNEFSKLITKYGGSRLNAYTSFERTVYFNAFTPQYLEQWLELNSERMINPVFRLFQSELETVYEEKNMYANSPVSGAMERGFELYFESSPYRYPILGSTENLKNPDQVAMAAFFDKYYVGPNMGLILSGNFDPEIAIPMIEQKFSRIKSGQLNSNVYPKARTLTGTEKTTLKVQIPIIKGFAYAWRGVPKTHPDAPALRMMAQLLNNSNSTGLLDKLSVDGKMMAAMAMTDGFRDEGFLAVIGIPKILFQSYGAAQKLVNEQLERIKQGDFDQEMIDAIRLQNRRSRLMSLENLDDRSSLLVDAFALGMSWDEYVALNELSDKVTKEEVVRVANKYLSDDKIVVTKKSGSYPKDNLKKPPFAPIIPPNAEAKSEYAMQLERIPTLDRKPQFVDFDKDVNTLKLSPLVTLYTKENPKNDLFVLTLKYGVGTDEKPILGQVAQYIRLLGTNDKSFDEFKNQYQQRGASIDRDAEASSFTITIRGFDNDFEFLVGATDDFIRNVKADEKKMKQVADDIKAEDKTFTSSVDGIADALNEYVKYGSRSVYLNRITRRDIGKIKGSDLVSLFGQATAVQAEIHYSGTLSAAEVERVIRAKLNIEGIIRTSNNPVYREPESHDKPVVFFVNYKGATQTIINGITKTREIANDADQAEAVLFNIYFGGGMGSVLFQQIREYRSYAYGTYSHFYRGPRILGAKPGFFNTYLSTQNDKAIDALSMLDSLQKTVVMNTEKFEAAKKNYLNIVTIALPNFRDVSEEIASDRQAGWERSRFEIIYREIEKLSEQQVNQFVNKTIRPYQTVYTVVGDESKIDMKALSKFGEIRKITIKQIYKK